MILYHRDIQIYIKIHNSWKFGTNPKAVFELAQRFPTFLMLWPLGSIRHVVATPTIKWIISLSFHCIFAANYYVFDWYFIGTMFSGIYVI